MIFLKGLIFILVNMFIGYLLAFSIKFFLFLPRKERRIHGKKIPFTPGFLHRKKQWLMDKIRGLLHDYLRDIKDEDPDSRLSSWELKAFKKMYEKLKSISEWKLIPAKIKEKIRTFLAVIVYEIVKQFLRSFVPYLIEKFNPQKYIELLYVKLDMELIEGYFNNYVYKFLLIFMLGLNFLIGVVNMIIYLSIA